MSQFFEKLNSGVNRSQCHARTAHLTFEHCFEDVVLYRPGSKTIPMTSLATLAVFFCGILCELHNMET